MGHIYLSRAITSHTNLCLYHPQDSHCNILIWNTIQLKLLNL